jgi:hypothetical protein
MKTFIKLGGGLVAQNCDLIPENAEITAAPTLPVPIDDCPGKVVGRAAVVVVFGGIEIDWDSNYTAEDGYGGRIVESHVGPDGLRVIDKLELFEVSVSSRHWPPPSAEMIDKASRAGLAGTR